MCACNVLFHLIGQRFSCSKANNRHKEDSIASLIFSLLLAVRFSLCRGAGEHSCLAAHEPTWRQGLDPAFEYYKIALKVDINS